VTEVADPAAALLVTGFAYAAEERREQARREGHLIGKVRDVRRFGSAALDLAYTASGRVDCYYESFGEPWDWAAGRLLVEEAGGRVSDVPGVRPGVAGILASGAKVHDALLALIGAIGPA
jgi:myo-inositol-1(or 4)-monophosphatase